MTYTLPNLNNLSTDEFIARIKAAPENTTSLDFLNNDLSLRSSSDLTRILGAISELKFVNKLDLSNTKIFDNKTSHDYAQFLAFIPQGITTLHLGDNSLKKKTVYEITHLFTAVPAGVSTLTLRYTNIFQNKKTAESVRCVAAITKNIKHLDLNGSGLIVDKNSRDVAKIVAAIPKTVETLCVDYRGLKAANTIKASLIISAELRRLHPFNGVSSYQKREAFANLAILLGNKEVNPALFLQQIEEWKQRHLPSINEQRNRLHAFFAPKHKTESFLMLEKIFAILEISLEVKEPSLPQESVEPSF